MSYLIDVNEELSEQVQEQLRQYRQRINGRRFYGWYKIQSAMARARDTRIYHDKIENFLLPELFDDNGDPITWYHWRDPQEKQVNEVKRNLKQSMSWKRKRGQVGPGTLRSILLWIMRQRLDEYMYPKEQKTKLRVMCVVGEAGVGKTLATLHLRYKRDANVVCSFTTRIPRETEVEGRDYHFIDIVPDKTDIAIYSHMGHTYTYALRWQFFGSCTVIETDEKGVANMRRDYGGLYDIHTVLITRTAKARRKVGVAQRRLAHDADRDLCESDFDYIVRNDSTKAGLFRQIEAIYEEVWNKDDIPTEDENGI